MFFRDFAKGGGEGGGEESVFGEVEAGPHAGDDGAGFVVGRNGGHQIAQQARGLGGMGVDENIERLEVADRRIRPPCGVADQLLGFRAEELVLSDRGVSTRMVAQAHGPFVGVSGSGKDLCGDHPGLAGIDFSEPVEQGEGALKNSDGKQSRQFFLGRFHHRGSGG